jgi:hypothetical protein
MYDLWESILLESEIESQVNRRRKKQNLTNKLIIISHFKALKKVACVMEKQISVPLTNFRTYQTFQLTINKEHRRDFDEILKNSREIVEQVQDEYSKKYDNQGVTHDYHVAHNEYILELTGLNSLYAKYQYNILPQLLKVRNFIFV